MENWQLWLNFGAKFFGFLLDCFVCNDGRRMGLRVEPAMTLKDSLRFCDGNKVFAEFCFYISAFCILHYYLVCVIVALFFAVTGISITYILSHGVSCLGIDFWVWVCYYGVVRCGRNIHLHNNPGGGNYERNRS